MQALYLKNGQLDYRRDAPEPHPQAGQVLLRVLLASRSIG